MSYLWLIARPGGQDAKILRTENDHPRGAILARIKDDDDPIWEGQVVAAWQLGKFPTQFYIGPDGLKELKRESVEDET